MTGQLFFGSWVNPEFLREARPSMTSVPGSIVLGGPEAEVNKVAEPLPASLTSPSTAAGAKFARR